MAYGPGESRFVEEKRHYEKPIPISRPGAPRPRALHPVRPLHPLRQGGGRRPADPLHQPGQRHRGQHLPRRAVRLVLQRQHRADLPGRRAHGQAVPVQGPPVGPRAGRVHLHRLLGRLPDRRRTSSPQPGAALPRRRHRPGQLGLALRQGPLRLRGRRQPTTASATPLVRSGDELVPAALGRGPRPRPADGPRGSTTRAGGGRRARRGAPHQRGRLRLGQAGQGRHRHRPRRRPARRRPAGRAGARPAPGHDRRRLRAGRHRRAARARSKEELPVLFLRLRHAVDQGRRQASSRSCPGRAASPATPRLAAAPPR